MPTAAGQRYAPKWLAVNAGTGSKTSLLGGTLAASSWDMAGLSEDFVGLSQTPVLRRRRIARMWPAVLAGLAFSLSRW